MYNRVRLTPEQRKRLIIDAAIDEALEKGLYSLSIVNVSRRLENCSRSLIKQYFRTLTGLKSEVIRHALDHEHHKIVAQAIVQGDDAVAHLTSDNKKTWLQGAI